MKKIHRGQKAWHFGNHGRMFARSPYLILQRGRLELMRKGRSAY